MSYDFLIKKFLEKPIEIQSIYDINMKYFSDVFKSKSEKSKSKNKVEKIIVKNEEYDIQKLEDLFENHLRNNEFLLAFPSVQSFISHNTTLIGTIKKDKNSQIVNLFFDRIEDDNDLKNKLWNNLSKKGKNISNGVCIVCGKETKVIPINMFVSASTLTNPFNFEFDNFKKFSYGLCKDHIDRSLWFYLLDIWNKATPLNKIGDYYLKIFLYLENLPSKNLLETNKKFYNDKEFNIKNLIFDLKEIKEELNIEDYRGNLFVIIYSVVSNKAAVYRIYNIYNITEWLEATEKLLNKIDVDQIIEFIKKIPGKNKTNKNKTKEEILYKKAQLEIFDLIFQNKRINKLLLLKKSLYEYFRKLYFDKINKKFLKDCINITNMVLSENYSEFRTAGYIVGLVDKWYSIKGYNTRVGQIVFSKRNPSIRDIKLAVTEALRRINLRDDLRSYVQTEIKNTEDIKRILEEFRDDNIRDIDISLLFSTGYFEAFNKQK